MRVLVVHNDYQSHQIGGEDMVVNCELAGLKAALGENQVMTYRVSNDTIRLGKLVRRLWGDADHAKAIQSLVRQHAIDIVHVHNFFPLLTARVFQAAKSAGAVVVHTLHNFRWWCSAGTLYRERHGQCTACVDKAWGFPSVLHGCYRGSRLQSLAASLAFFWYHMKHYAEAIDAYFALSQCQIDTLADFGLHEKIWLKPNPIDPPKAFVPAEQKRDYLYVGRLEEAKGLPGLLRLWKTLPQHFILRVVGDGEARADLENRYAANNIRFYGNRPHEEVLQQMAKSRFLIHPGLAMETFGLTVVEALAQGTPVIGLSVGTRPEFIQDGHNGFLSDMGGLRQIILDSATTPHYSNMQQAAYDSVKRFYRDAVIKQQIQLYHTLLERK